ncbi:MAG: insulinase family protein [bacterium]|nr:insulinase family protein [bacterium]
MKVLLWEDDTIPSLAIYTFWKVGSRNETVGNTGLAHFFEHMMFNGSANYAPGEFDRVMEDAGGSNNAYTSRNITAYQDWVPADALEVTLELEADRIRSLAVDPEVVESERGVVISERKQRIGNDNFGRLWEILDSTAYLAHPYSWPVLGWESDIENWRQRDVEEFFQSWYAPNNAVMVICGAFDEDNLLALLEEKIGSIPARDVPRGVVTVEPPQSGERRAILRKEASLGCVLAAWHIPEYAHEDLRVFELIDLILNQGESSRLYRRLVDQEQTALWSYIRMDDGFDPGLFQILVQSRAGVAGEVIEAALYEELELLKSEPVSERELAKAKNMLIADFYREMASISGRADALGAFQLFHGDWRNLFNVVERYQAITVEDLMRVAQLYLVEDNRTVVTLIPIQATAEEGRNAN